MEDFPTTSGPEGQPWEGDAPETAGTPASPEHIDEMVKMGRDIQRHDGAYYLKPIMSRPNMQMMHVVDHKHTSAEFWFEHLNELNENEFLISHGIVDESSRFLMFMQALSYEDILKPGEIVNPQELLRVTRLDTRVVNDTHPVISRDEVLRPVKDSTFSRYYDDIYWLRNHLYLY